MSEATFYYFDGRGKGEIIRFMLAAAEVKYEEVILTQREQMVQLMSDGLLTFDQLPLLKIDGLSLVQSGAIVRYLARRKSGLYGKDNKEVAMIDVYFEGSRDFNNPFLALKFKDVREVLDTVKATCLPRYLPAFEKVLKANGTGYLVGSSITLADIGLFEAVSNTIEFIGQDALKDYPNIQKFYKTIRELPKISGFLASPFRKRANDDRYVADVKRVLNW